MKVPSVYLKGCHRVATPVTMSLGFQNIVSEKVSDEMEAIAGLENEARATAFAEHVLRKLNRVTLYNVEETDICYFGKTRNNVREFDFIEFILNESNIQHSKRFFLQQFSASKAPLKGLHRNTAKLLVENLTQLVKSQDRITGAHLRQLLEYTRYYLNITISYHRRQHLLPKVGVVANDHSPSQVAFAAAMEANAVPVVYVQHAEVTPAFPPLDFEASILRNEASLATYKAISPPRGRVFVLSRNLEEVRYAEVMRDLGPTTTVGIFPTSRFNPSALRRAVETLRQNTAVGDVFIKPHPNSATLTEEDAGGAELRESIPEAPFVALAGNSSVVVELLARGIPVFLLFDLDEIAPDYYGFVRDGLAPQVLPEKLSHPFWQTDFYGPLWYQRLAKFDPAVTGDMEASRRELSDYLAELIRRPTARPPFKLRATRLASKYLRTIKHLAEAIFATLPPVDQTK